MHNKHLMECNNQESYNLLVISLGCKWVKKMNNRTFDSKKNYGN